MQVAVIGAGYVGLVSAAGLAASGHRVWVGESDPGRLDCLERGDIPIYEADLERIVQDGLSAGLLTFHRDNREAVADAEVVIIALPTPPSEDGSADLATVEDAIRAFATTLRRDAVIAMKSTVPVGSIARFQALLDDLGVAATMVANPEFLREGSAVSDFFHPDRIVIGSRDQRSAEVVAEMYRSIQAPIVITSPESAEMIKYASNAYLATRITFANAIANLCEVVGADVKDVLEGMGYDRRIGFHFFNPGPGFGGSCLPKDTRALVAIADAAGYDFSLLRGVIEVNHQQLERIVTKVADAVGSLQDAKVAIWGLAFKAHTDDTRESPALGIARALVSRGVLVKAYDPAVPALADPGGIEVVGDALGAVENADVLVIATEWPEFVAVDLRSVSGAMSGDTIVDARNLLDRISVQQVGMKYVGVGQ